MSNVAGMTAREVIECVHCRIKRHLYFRVPRSETKVSRDKVSRVRGHQALNDMMASAFHMPVFDL